MQNDTISIRNARSAVNAALNDKRKAKQPIAKFDVKNKIVYLENSDGTIEIIGECIYKDRYSERCRKNA